MAPYIAAERNASKRQSLGRCKPGCCGHHAREVGPAGMQVSNKGEYIHHWPVLRSSVRTNATHRQGVMTLELRSMRGSQASARAGLLELVILHGNLETENNIVYFEVVLRLSSLVLYR